MASLEAVAGSADVMAAPASGEMVQLPIVAAIDPSAAAGSGDAMADSTALTAAPTGPTTEAVAVAGTLEAATGETGSGEANKDLPTAQVIDGSGSWISHVDPPAGGSGEHSAVFDDDVVMPAAGGIPRTDTAAGTDPVSADHSAESEEDEDDFYPRDAGAGAVDIFGTSDSGTGPDGDPTQSEAAGGVATMEGDAPEAAPRPSRAGARAATRENLAGIPTKHGAWREKRKVNPVRFAVGVLISGLLGVAVAYGMFKLFTSLFGKPPRSAPPARSAIVPSPSNGSSSSSGTSGSPASADKSSKPGSSAPADKSGKPGSSKKPVNWKGLEKKTFK